MGRRGPAPAPTAEKRLKGESRPSRINSDEPQLPAPKTHRPPAGLSGPGRSEWTRLVAVLSDRGVLTEADLAAFEDYCRALSHLRSYEAKAKGVGLELAIAKGYAGMVVKLRAQVSQLRAQVGLSPASRSAVKARLKEKAESRTDAFKATKSGAPLTLVPGNARGART